MTMTDPDPTLRPDRLPEDTDRALRPQTLDDFIGQEEARANLRVFTESARRGARRWITSCSMVPPAWARRRWRRSWRANWA
jgi:hypothetical protein